MENVTHIPTPKNFVYPNIKPTVFKFGAATEVFAVPLRANSDWRDYLPPCEEQRRNGIESSACYKEAQQHTIATILEEQYGIVDQNYSGRFNDQENATPHGGSPINAADSIRHDGLIPDEMLPFSPDIKSWQEFNSFLGSNQIECVKEGLEWLKKWDPKYDVVFTKDEQVENKYEKIKEALQFSPLPVSVTAWYLDNKTGLYIKPPGMDDGHLVELVYVDDEGYPYIFDTYTPFVKKLDKYFNFDFGMRWTVDKRVTPPVTNSNWLLDIIKNIIKFLFP